MFCEQIEILEFLTESRNSAMYLGKNSVMYAIWSKVATELFKDDDSHYISDFVKKEALDNFDHLQPSEIIFVETNSQKILDIIENPSDDSIDQINDIITELVKNS